MKKVTVITPCYNNERFILDCVKSVAASITFKKFELEHVVVDDASTDRSWEILQKLNLKHLKIYRLTKNRGSGTARNYAIKKIDTDFLFCLDGDDVLFQTSLLKLLGVAGTTGQDWVYGDFLRVNEDLSYIIGNDYYGSQFESIDDVLLSIYLGEHFFQHSSIFSLKMIEKIGYYDETRQYPDDLDLFTRFLLNGHYPYYFSGPLYLHRFHKTNLSRAHLMDKTLHFKNLVKLYQKYQAQMQIKLGEEKNDLIKLFLTNYQ